jgi:Fe2+ transport system protein FeoA
VRLRASGREHRLSPAQAASVDVEEVPSSAPAEARRSLAALRPGERVRVAALTCRGLTRRRLLDLGLVPGTPVEAVMRSILGDPVAYRVRGTLFALRRAQAEQVLLEPTPVGGEVAA